MIRRDSEQGDHKYSKEIFKELKIFDIQGLLKEGDVYNCGVEAYQVKDFDLINFSKLNQDLEEQRLLFCKQLEIPYYIIITSENTKTYQFYKTSYSDGKITFKLDKERTKEEAMQWWKKNQSFDQKKPMYEAAPRIRNSMIDLDLEKSNLAWGVNIDGFILGRQIKKNRAIIENRYTTFPLKEYDPNKWFKHKGGDYKSWNILFNLSKKLKVPLILLTFRKDTSKTVGASVVFNVDREGLTYKYNIKPYQNIFSNDLEGLKGFFRKEL